MTDADLIRRACATSRGYLRLGNEAFDAHNATFVRSLDTPRRYDANHADNIRCETRAEIDALLAAWPKEYAHAKHERYDVDPLTPQPSIARLVLENFTWNPTLQSLLEGDLNAKPRDVDIREVTDDAGWAEYGRLDVLDWQGNERNRGRDVDPTLMAEFQRYKRAKQPDVRYWLAYEDGAARAYFSSWPGIDGLGMVEDLFTEEPYRHRGLATALIAHCVADARARGAREILIGAEPNDTPKHIYAAMGFRPLMITGHYLKT
ncbi:MAG TPA: GNAT family N-acetyltransferase, partial [Dehalococcoidia bacterium]